MNLGTLWFGADIDLSTLRQKIQNGNQSILDALKMNYDPASYTNMVNDIKRRLSSEVFEIKVSTNAQQVRDQLNQTVSSISNSANTPKLDLSGLRGISGMTRDILDQKEAIRDNAAEVVHLRNVWGNMIKQHGRSSEQAMNAFKEYDKARARLLEANYVLKGMNIERGKAMLAQSELNKQMRESSKAARQWNSDQLRLNTTLAGGIHISTQLGSALSSVFAVDAARQFLGNVIEIGGQLEKQRISIGAILGDTVKANHLFEQIKGLALKSPFGVVELDQYTKQLSAYGFRYNELFDMTKRLADISAGAGQDIGRLTLALGHVRSATYLTGITLRQFSMNNIPMLKMLSEYYTEVEKKAVSTADVQKRISKRQVSYEDVIEQIRRLTDEGGMFYNMQEKISESLSARFKNLKDAMDIMYGEMAESTVGDLLKDLAGALLKVTRHWKEIGAIMSVAAAAFVLSKIHIGANTLAMRGNTAATIKQITSTKQLEANNLRAAATYRTLTIEERRKIITATQLTAKDVQLAMATEKLTKDEVLNAIALKQMSADEARALILTGQFTKAEIEAALAAKKWRVALAGIGTSLKNAFAGIGVGTWATLAIMAATEIYMAYDQWNQRIDDKANEMKDLVKSRIIDLQKMQKELNTEEKPKDTTALKARVDEMKQVLANSEAYTKTLDEQLIKAGNLPKQYDILADAIDNAIKKNRKLLDVQDTSAKLIKSSKSDFTWWDVPKAGVFSPSSFRNIWNEVFNEGVSDNIADVNEAYKNLRITLENLYEFKEPFKEVIEEIMNNSDVSARIKEQLKDAPFEEQLRVLVENGYWEKLEGKIRSTGQSFKMSESEINDVCEALKVSFEGVSSTWGEIVDDDMKKMFDRLVEIRGGDEKKVRQWAVDNIEDYKMLMDGILDQIGEKEPSIRKAFKRMFYDYIRFSELEKGLAEGADIGARVFADINFDEENQATIKEDSGGGSKNNGNKKDKELEVAKTKLQEYKAFLSEYKKYREIYSKEKAIDLLETLFPNLKGQGANLVDNYADVLTKLRNSLAATTEARKKFINEVDKTGADTLFDRDKEKLKEYADATDEYIKRTEEQWKNYRALMKKSGGNKDIARMAFNPNGAIWDETAKKMMEEFNRLGNERGVVPALFNWDMNEKDLKKTLVDAKGVVQEDLVKLAQKIQDIIRGNYKQFADDTAEAYGKSLSAAEKLAELEEKRRDLVKKRDSDNDQSDTQLGYWNTQIAALDKQIADQKWEAFKETEQWGRIFSDLNNITTDTLSYMLDKLREVAPSIRDSVEATKALYEAMDKIQDQLYERNPFAALGGYFSQMSAFRSFMSDYGSRLSGLKSSDKISISADRAKEMKLNNGDEDWEGTVQQFLDAMYKASKGFSKIVAGIGKTFKALQDVLSPVIDLFDQLGMSGLSNVFQTGNNALSSAANIASGMSSLQGLFNDPNKGLGKLLGDAAPWAAAAGAGLSIVSSLFSMHDAALQEEIEASQARQKEMESLTKNLERVLDRTLGGFYNVSLDEFDRSQLSERSRYLSVQASLAEWFSKAFGGNANTKGLRDEIKLLQEALKTNDNYKAQKASLMAQREEIERQMRAEQDKKDSDESAIQGYKDSIQDIDDQIKHFAEDMAKAIYDIDIKSWAQELGDALFEAWQKGEDGAKAFKKKARKIITDVAKNIAVQKLIETALKPVLDIITSEMDRKSGKLDTESIQLLANAMEAVGTTLPDSFNALMDGLDAGLQKAGLGSMKDDVNDSNSITSGIKSITENTADLLASYINAMRGDLSLQRTDVYAIRLSVEALASRQNVIAEAQTEQMRQIAANTYRNADAADAILLILRRATQDKAFGIHVQ